LPGVVLLVGYGNTLRGDDGLGIRAAEMLFERWAGHGLAHLFCHQLTPELCEDVAAADTVLFLDARADGVPGTFDCVAVQEERDEGASYTHRCRPGDLLRLSRQVFGAVPRAWLMTMSAATFDGGETLSPEVVAAMPAFLARADEIIAAALDGGRE
jgi:hydrogenase maturation protease